jgi:hypothetical protein
MSACVYPVPGTVAALAYVHLKEEVEVAKAAVLKQARIVEVSFLSE